MGEPRKMRLEGLLLKIQLVSGRASLSKLPSGAKLEPREEAADIFQGVSPLLGADQVGGVGPHEGLQARQEAFGLLRGDLRLEQHLLQPGLVSRVHGRAPLPSASAAQDIATPRTYLEWVPGYSKNREGAPYFAIRVGR